MTHQVGNFLTACGLFVLIVGCAARDEGARAKGEERGEQNRRHLTRELPPVLADDATTQEVVFSLANDSEAEVRLGEPVRSCSCTSAVLGKKTLQPGDSARLTLTLHLKGRRGLSGSPAWSSRTAANPGSARFRHMCTSGCAFHRITSTRGSWLVGRKQSRSSWRNGYRRAKRSLRWENFTRTQRGSRSGRGGRACGDGRGRREGHPFRSVGVWRKPAGGQLLRRGHRELHRPRRRKQKQILPISWHASGVRGLSRSGSVWGGEEGGRAGKENRYGQAVGRWQDRRRGRRPAERASRFDPVARCEPR